MFYLRYPMNTELRFATAGRFTAHNNPLHPHRNLPSAVLLIGLSGSYPIAQDDREFVLCENSFLLLFPGHEHRGYAPATDAQSHYWCHFHFPQSSAPYADDCKECSEFLPVVVEDPDITLPENRKFCYLPEAGTLLLNSDLHIDMIAAECGFNDEKYFMKALKRSYGVTPTEYRNVYFRLHDNRT